VTQEVRAARFGTIQWTSEAPTACTVLPVPGQSEDHPQGYCTEGPPPFLQPTSPLVHWSSEAVGPEACDRNATYDLFKWCATRSLIWDALGLRSHFGSRSATLCGSMPFHRALGRWGGLQPFAGLPCFKVWHQRVPSLFGGDVRMNSGGNAGPLVGIVANDRVVVGAGDAPKAKALPMAKAGDSGLPGICFLGLFAWLYVLLHLGRLPEPGWGSGLRGAGDRGSAGTGKPWTCRKCGCGRTLIGKFDS
jgi:hypothetical protein